jgi:hypothetical protein
MFNYPGECDLEWLRPVFQNFGTVKRIYRNCLKEYPDIENGTITIVMNKEAVVSKMVWIKGNRFKTWYKGQEDELRVSAKCFRCGGRGHYRYECTATLGRTTYETESDAEGRKGDEDGDLGVDQLSEGEIAESDSRKENSEGDLRKDENSAGKGGLKEGVENYGKSDRNEDEIRKRDDEESAEVGRSTGIQNEMECVSQDSRERNRACEKEGEGVTDQCTRLLADARRIVESDEMWREKILDLI